MVANRIIYLLLHEAYIEIAKEHPTMIFTGKGLGFADSKKQKDCASTIPKSRYFYK